MRGAIETRELITVNVDGMRLRGTYHKSHGQGSDSRPERHESNRIGILFLNSGFVPRASAGDAAVYWADSFAECGYPSFRFDLPGLGDSDGDLPEKLLEFAGLVNAGYYAPFVAGIARDLTERFHLSGVVLAGHCAGAVSAIFSAAASEYVRGLVGLEAYFFREGPERTNVRKEISLLVARSKLVAQLSRVYGLLRKFASSLKRNPLPQNANLPLIRCCSRLVCSGMPILILNATEPRPNPSEFDYLSYLQRLSGRDGQLAVKFVEGTNHSFADDVGRTAVRRHIEQWLSSYFPLIESVRIAAVLSGTR